MCGLCQKPITSGADLHEVLITRGDISGAEALVPLIHVQENCALVHPGGCHRKAATKEGQRILAKHLIAWEGSNKVMAWLLSIRSQMVSDQANHAISLILEVTDGQEG